MDSSQQAASIKVTSMDLIRPVVSRQRRLEGRRHNPYASGIKVYEQRGGNRVTDVTPYQEPQIIIQSKRGRPRKTATVNTAQAEQTNIEGPAAQLGDELPTAEVPIPEQSQSSTLIRRNDPRLISNKDPVLGQKPDVTFVLSGPLQEVFIVPESMHTLDTLPLEDPLGYCIL